MKALPDEAAEGWLRNICAECDDDRLRHPAARRWLGPRCTLRKNLSSPKHSEDWGWN